MYKHYRFNWCITYILCICVYLGITGGTDMTGWSLICSVNATTKGLLLTATLGGGKNYSITQ